MKIKFLKILSFLPIVLITTSCNKNSDAINAWINEGNQYEGTKDGDPIWAKIEENTGVKLSITGATHGTSYYQTLNPKLTSPNNNLDIVFSVPSNKNCSYETLVEQDVYWDLDDLLSKKEDKYPSLRKIIYSDEYKNIVYGNNTHYLIPYLTSKSGWAIYYRSDWLKNIGFVDENGNPRTPKTINEFTEVLEKFTNNDPDQNGQNDTYGLSPAGEFFYWSPLYHAFGVTPDYDLDSNNDVNYMYTQPEFKNFLSWSSEMYQKGYIDPQYSANAANNQDRDKFYKGNVGILITNGESHVQWIVPGTEKLQGKNKIIVGEAPLGTSTLGKEGAGGFSDWGGYWGGYSIVKHLNGTSPNYERAYSCLDLLEYLYSQDGGLLRMHGIKDTHWKYNDSNEIEPIYENRNEEKDGTFFSVQDQNGSKRLSGTYQMGSAWGNRINWKDDGSFECIINNCNVPYNCLQIFNDTVSKNSVVSSKLVNFTGYSSSFREKINTFENEMDKFANEVTMGKKGLDSWNTEMTTLESNYSWKQIKDMMKEKIQSRGII